MHESAIGTKRALRTGGMAAAARQTKAMLRLSLNLVPCLRTDLGCRR